MKPTTLVPNPTALQRFALHATKTCAVEASAYGKCIVATHTDVHKDACKAEFEKFGRCLREAVRFSLSFNSRRYSGAHDRVFRDFR
jgi:NADH dehydrogenase [ubiquinone] 1 alpha subcomplex assembly factor 8